jgi:hypothetical protein
MSKQNIKCQKEINLNVIQLTNNLTSLSVSNEVITQAQTVKIYILFPMKFISSISSSPVYLLRY